MTFDELLARLGASESGDGWLAICPAHDDSEASLRIALGHSRVLLKCRAGCETDAVLTAAGLTFADLPKISDVGDVARRAVSTDTPAPTAAVAALKVRLDAYAHTLAEAALSPGGPKAAHDALVYALDRFGIGHDQALALGLGVAEDLGGGPRLVVPFRDGHGVARGFQARSLDRNARVRWLGPKSPEGASWSKVACFRSASESHPEIVVTEGPGDGLTACGAGYDSAAVRGAALATNPTVLDTIADFADGRPVVVIGDADPAGDKFAREIAGALAARGLSVRKVRPPREDDDLSSWRENDPGRFTTALVDAVQAATDPGALQTRLEAWPDPAQTELAQAKRLRERIESADSGVRFTPEKGFHLLDYGVWREDTLDAVRTFAQDAALDVWREAQDLLDTAEEAHASATKDSEKERALRATKRAKKLLAFARLANSSRGIDAVVRELKALKGVAASLNDFDKHAHLIAARNGVVNLKTGELQEHDASLLISRRVECDFVPSAKAERFERFLEEIFVNHPTLVPYMRRLVGYGITGETREQCFAVLYGVGANGKSVLTDTLTEVFREHTTTTPFSTFEFRPSGGIPNDLAALKGARLVMASEGEQGRPMAESVLKRVTGHDLISARFMRQEFFEFRPTFLLMLASNFRPSFRGQDEGLWRRVKLLPFERFFAPHEREHGLSHRLLDEREGIFAWAVRGAVEWYANGLEDPEVVRAETKQYRETSDALAGFIPGVFEKEEGAITKLSTLWERYLEWADEENLPQKERWTRKAFAGALEERGLEKRKRAQGIVFVGVRRSRASDHHEDEPEDVRALTVPLAVSSPDAF